MSNHTPESWHVFQLANDPEAYGTKALKHIIVDESCDKEITSIVWNEDDAKRIVECVNWLGGYSSEDLKEMVSLQSVLLTLWNMAACDYESWKIKEVVQNMMGMTEEEAKAALKQGDTK